MSCSVYNIHYTLKPTSTYSGTLDTLKHQLNQVLRLYLGGAVGSVVYKIKDEFRSMSLRAQFLQDDWAQRADNDLLMENVGAVGEGARICQLVRAFITLDHLRLAGCTERCASSCVMN